MEIVLAVVDGVGDIVRGRARSYWDCDAVTPKPDTGERCLLTPPLRLDDVPGIEDEANDNVEADALVCIYQLSLGGGGGGLDVENFPNMFSVENRVFSFGWDSIVSRGLRSTSWARFRSSSWTVSAIALATETKDGGRR